MNLNLLGEESFDRFFNMSDAIHIIHIYFPFILFYRALDYQRKWWSDLGENLAGNNISDQLNMN